MRRDAVLGALLLAIALALAFKGLGTMYRIPDRQSGDGFPALALSSLDGSAASFDGRGQPAIVTVFTTWCVPCREEFGKIAGASASPWGSKVRFVEIDENESSRRVGDFLKAYPQLRASVFVDGSGAVHALGIYSIPRTLAVASNGRVTGHFDGPMGYGDLRRLVAGAERSQR